MEGTGRSVVEPARLPSWFRDRTGLIAAGIYLLAILYFEHVLVAHLGSVCSCENTDPTQWMWVWRWIPYAISHGMNPLLTHEIWNPTAYDVAATTPSPTTAILGVPFEALFGPLAAYNLVMFTAPVLSGWAAYRLCRYVSGAPWASVLAGYTYGFSAYEFGQLLGHLDLIFVFVPPLLVLVVLQRLNGEISRRRAVVYVTVLLLLQFGLDNELLLDLTYLGAFALVMGYIFAPDYRRRLLEVALVLIVAYVALAVIGSYYLYEELRGPTESSATAALYPADLLSYVVPTHVFRIGGNRFSAVSAQLFTASAYEQDTYLGLPLCGVLLAFLMGGWRHRATKLIGLTTAAAFILSLGLSLTILGHPTFRMPFYYLYKLPLVDLSIPSRLGVFVSLGAALAAAMWISWARGRGNQIWRWLVGLIAVACLAPNLSDIGTERYPQPRFFTTDLYRHYLTRNEVVMAFPYSQRGPGMLWEADTGLYFRLFDGYLGFTPQPYVDSPLYPQLFYGFPVSGSEAQLVREFGAQLKQGGVQAVVVQDGQGEPWTGYLLKLGWHQQADVGGVEVYKPSRA